MLSEADKNRRRLQRQAMVAGAAIKIRESLGGSSGPIEERLEMIRVAALGAVAESWSVMRALKAKKIITDVEEQEFLDWGYEELCRRIHAGTASKVFQAGGNG